MSVLCAGLLAFGLAAAPTPAGAATPHYDHNSPTTNWGGYTCADDAELVKMGPVTDTSRTQVAAIRLMSSGRCGTWWAEIVSSPASSPAERYSVSASIDTVSPDLPSERGRCTAESVGENVSGCLTPMVTSDCSVVVTGQMRDGSNGDVVAEGEVNLGLHCPIRGAGVGGR